MSDESQFKELSAALHDVGQSHLLAYWTKLDNDQRKCLINQLRSFGDLKLLIQDYNNAINARCPDPERLKKTMSAIPVDRCSSMTKSGKYVQAYWEKGLCTINEGRIGVLLLAGGQGTRLGVSYPKGMVSVGLPSQKTLFQLQAERIHRLQQISKTLGTNQRPVIPWYIMTSESTRQMTEEFFETNKYFGLNKSDVMFFNQGIMPCFDLSGKILMEAVDKVATSPDGNGGLYKALVTSGYLKDMKMRGLKYLHVYGVDNILVRVADPCFLGYFMYKDADCGCKVVEKTEPSEPIGIVCNLEGVGPSVVEYSEMPEQLTKSKNSDGSLTYKAGNIANHLFTFDFLEKLCTHHINDLVYHVAEKRIPYVDKSGQCIKPETPNGVKLEKFVFDVFRFSERFYVWEVDRSSEFSPLKNATGQDSMQTCLDNVLAVHKNWILSVRDSCDNMKLYNHLTRNKNCDINGLDLTSDFRVEISPLISYQGEGLLAQLKKCFTLDDFEALYLAPSAAASSTTNKLK